MNYSLNNSSNKSDKKKPLKGAWIVASKKLLLFMGDEKKNIFFALVAIVINAGLNLCAPIIVGHTIDTYIATKQYGGVFLFSGILFVIFLVAFFANYFQMILMGSVGQRVVFKVRNAIFTKLQELPVAFFNQNKSGDLISRINNDTDKLNQFFSQALTQFIGSFFVILGTGIFILFINIKLGSAALAPAVCLIIITQLISPWVKKRNAKSLQETGGMSAEIQESLTNFKVIVACNRRDYFRDKFSEANQTNFKASVRAGIANNVFSPLYGLASNIGQLIVLVYGIHLISTANITIGLLIGFIMYVNRFYDPFRQVASMWSSLQLALAAWDRISTILSLESDLKLVAPEHDKQSNSFLCFRNVHFAYPNGKEVLHSVSFCLERGKTYALVGPTGGGKTTTASLMARLYDPTQGSVFLNGKDIRSYEPAKRTEKIGFILQEPYLFSGSVGDNIIYGNPELSNIALQDLQTILDTMDLGNTLARFEKGLSTPVTTSGDSISLGQKQIIAFIRAVLKKPELLILDEATAHIDTVTEQILGDILKNLPAQTTRVVIAHRLNTIENADEIFLVNSGQIIRAGSFEQAINMLLHEKRNS